MRARIVNQFSLATMLLLVAIVGLAMALWLEWRREPEVFYLHVYSNR